MIPGSAPELRPRSSRPSLRKEPSLADAIRRFARDLRTEFAGEIARDARAFRKRVLHLFRTALPVDRGRPRLMAVTRATEMRAQGKCWRAIYAVCIAPDLRGDSRILAQSRLRGAVRARRRPEPAEVIRN
jgi:hypothetical protein